LKIVEATTVSVEISGFFCNQILREINLGYLKLIKSNCDKKAGAAQMIMVLRLQHSAELEKFSCYSDIT